VPRDARLLFKTEDQLEARVGGVALGDPNLFARQEAPVGAI